MQTRNSIVNIPLLVGLILSIALHGAALYGKGIHTPPEPMIEQGRTVVQLTLIPSISSKGNPGKGDIDVAPTPAPPVPKPARPPKPIPVPQAARLPDPTPPPPEQPKAQSPEPKASSPAPDQDASLIEEKGVTTDAQAVKAASPVYPRISRRRGEEGTVTLAIDVPASGKAGNISVLQSSGYRRLDEAALKAAQKTRFTPAKQFGRDIDSTTELSFTFRLTDD